MSSKFLIFLGLVFLLVLAVSAEVATETSKDDKKGTDENEKTVADEKYQGGGSGGCQYGRCCRYGYCHCCTLSEFNDMVADEKYQGGGSGGCHYGRCCHHGYCHCCTLSEFNDMVADDKQKGGSSSGSGGCKHKRCCKKGKCWCCKPNQFGDFLEVEN